MRTTDFIDHLREQTWYSDQIAHVERIGRQRARYGRLRKPLPRPLDEALRRAGLSRFYRHQADGINAVRAGKHVIVSTGTASGKTLVYHVPTLEALLTQRGARALYIFPTKALAQDQLRALKELAAGCLPDLKVDTYDGDTPQGQRARIRASAQVILTNPDMLSLGILPNHALWSRFFSNLRYVVVDEAHVYRGVFGSHVANVLRRLRRICAHYGANPQFICCSATVANPGEHMARLTGVEPVVAVGKDGSPHGPRDFVLWNPPLIDEPSGTRRSANTEATHLFVELVISGIRNITFTRSRRTAELVQLYARGVLADQAPKLVDRVRTYRAGYLPKQRREIERGLFKGQIIGVTATNALELGVDIGDLDATALVGYPGTVASTWQQAGRAGRGEAHALSFLIGLDGPLDQYLMRHPDYLFARPVEHALIDPGNPYILPAHLCCAAFELPLSNEDEALFGGESFVQAMIALEQRGLLEYRQDRWYYMGMGYPAEDVHIRSSTGEQFDIVDASAGYQLIESIDAATALYQVHPGAVYLHQGESYLVTELDLLSRTAYVVPTEAKFYTQPKDAVDVHIVRSYRSRLVGGVAAYFGVVRVRTQVVGYRKKRQFTDEVLDEVPLDLPPQEFDTVAVWWDLPEKLIRRLKTRGRDVAGGLHAMEHACIGMLPLFAMCDRLDLGGLSTECHQDTGQPQVFVYDAFPGGVGIAEKGFGILEQWWTATLQAIVECPCEDGCPSCVQSPRCGNNNEPLDKDVARVLLTALTRGTLPR